jgi:hypothetical protein
MSYDICVGYWHRGHNYTYNVAPMLAAAGFSWRDWDGKPSDEVAVELRRVICEMEADPVKFRALEPSNGWGDYQGCLKWLRTILDDINEMPAPEPVYVR